MLETELTKLWCREKTSFKLLNDFDEIYGDLVVKANGQILPGLEPVHASECSLARWVRDLSNLRKMVRLGYTKMLVADGDPSTVEWTFSCPDPDGDRVFVSCRDVWEGKDFTEIGEIELSVAQVVSASEEFRRHVQELLLKYLDEPMAKAWWRTSTRERWDRK